MLKPPFSVFRKILMKSHKSSKSQKTQSLTKSLLDIIVLCWAICHPHTLCVFSCFVFLFKTFYCSVAFSCLFSGLFLSRVLANGQIKKEYFVEADVFSILLSFLQYRIHWVSSKSWTADLSLVFCPRETVTRNCHELCNLLLSCCPECFVSL